MRWPENQSMHSQSCKLLYRRTIHHTCWRDADLQWAQFCRSLIALAGLAQTRHGLCSPIQVEMKAIPAVGLFNRTAVSCWRASSDYDGRMWPLDGERIGLDIGKRHELAMVDGM